jgi:hypothetical protein
MAQVPSPKTTLSTASHRFRRRNQASSIQSVTSLYVQFFEIRGLRSLIKALCRSLPSLIPSCPFPCWTTPFSTPLPASVMSQGFYVIYRLLPMPYTTTIITRVAWRLGPGQFIIYFALYFSYSLDRPVNDLGERVTPSDLPYHRRSRRFVGPCCLCAAEYPMLVRYTEAAIFCSPFGVWVAACAKSRCLYWGTLSRYLCIFNRSHTCQSISS